MTRLVSGLALAAGALALVWWLPPARLVFVALAVCALAFFEYARLVAAIGAPVPLLPTLAATLAACGAAVLPPFSLPALFGVLLVVTAAWLMATGASGAALFNGTTAALLAPLYLGLPLAALVGIHTVAGREGVLTLVATVAASDTAQFYTGRAFGRRPLAPTISPKKTSEGAVGGFVVAPLVLAALTRLWLPWASLPLALVAGLALVVAGICGDLFESALKRAADVKDSGTLIPGHGGVLDRIDALLFASPIFYLFLQQA
jgi:phosphatidate cytidylyltransferase